jgi:hypothetical protein
MTKSSRLVVIAIATSLLWFGLATSVDAQRNPPMPSETRDREKESLYNEFSEYRKSMNPDQQRLAYPTAKAYLRQFGGDDDSFVKDVQRFVDEYERRAHDSEVFQAYGARDYAKTFDLGRPLLRKAPEDFFLLATLTEAGYENALAGNASLNTETADYARKAIAVLEAGQITQADPFKSLEVARFLTQPWDGSSETSRRLKQRPLSGKRQSLTALIGPTH